MYKENVLPVNPEAIVRQLVDFTGKTITYRFREAIENNPSLLNWLVAGPPGAGKRTIIMGLISFYLREYPELVTDITTISFDTYRQQFLQELATMGIYVTSLIELDIHYQKAFARYLKNAYFQVYESQESGDRNARKHKNAIETPLDGVVDRGQEAAKAFAHRNRKSRTVETFAAYIIPDFSVILRAKRERDIAVVAQNDFELLLLFKEAGILIRDETEKDKKSTALLSRYRMMATSTQIDSIREEVRPLINATYKQILEYSGPNVIKAVKHSLVIPSGVRIQSQEEWEEIVKHVFYAYAHLTKLGFNQQACVVAINQVVDKIQH